MMKKLLFSFLALFSFMLSFGQIVIYEIPMSQTVGLTLTSGDMCSAPYVIEEAKQTTLGNSWGATWTSVNAGTPSSVQVELMFTISDGGTAFPTTLNGVSSGNVDSSPLVNCNTGVLLTWNIDPTNYYPMASNTFLVNYSSSSQVNQLDNLPTTGGSDIYLKVTVDYTPCIPPSVALNSTGMPTCAGGSDGNINIDVTGGTSPYAFDWDNDGTGDFDDSEDLTGIPAGAYNVTVQDATGCSTTYSVSISDPAGLDTSVTQTGNTLMSNATGVTYQWVSCPGYSAVSGETNASFTPTVDGDYAVIVGAGPCSDTSACYSVSGANVQELEEEMGIDVYPNPTNGILQFAVAQNKYLDNISVYDMEGRMIAYYAKAPANHQIDLSAFENGVYFIHFNQYNESNVIVRVVKY